MPDPVVHFEIGCKNIDSARKFYSGLFGWEYAPGDPKMGMIANIGGFAKSPTAGIGGHLSAQAPQPCTYVVVYVQVDDIAATLAKAERMGGTTMIPATEVPNLGHFAWFKDPEGNTIGLWKPMLG